MMELIYNLEKKMKIFSSKLDPVCMKIGEYSAFSSHRRPYAEKLQDPLSVSCSIAELSVPKLAPPLTLVAEILVRTRRSKDQVYYIFSEL